MTPVRSTRAVLILLLALDGATAACQSKPAAPPVSADAWAVVNGREITRQDVEKAYRRNLQAEPPASEEEVAAAKLEVLDQLIENADAHAPARKLLLLSITAIVYPAHSERQRRQRPDFVLRCILPTIEPGLPF